MGYYAASLATENLLRRFEEYAAKNGIEADGPEDLANFGNGLHEPFLKWFFEQQDAISTGAGIELALALPERLAHFVWQDDGDDGCLKWSTDSVVGEEAVRIAQLAAYVATQWLDAADDVWKAAAHQILVVAHG